MERSLIRNQLCTREKDFAETAARMQRSAIREQSFNRQEPRHRLKPPAPKSAQLFVWGFFDFRKCLGLRRQPLIWISQGVQHVVPVVLRVFCKMIPALPRRLPFTRRCNGRKGPVIISSIDAPYRQFCCDDTVKKRGDEARMPTRVHAHRCRPPTFAYPYHSPWPLRTVALVAMGQRQVPAAVFERRPAWILLTRRAVVPIPHDNARFD